MPAEAIICDRQSDAMRPTYRALSMIRDGFNELQKARNGLIRFNAANLALAADWALLATEGGFEPGGYGSANAAAMAAYAEMDSLYSKLATDNSVAEVNTAIFQAAAKLNA
jgi:hypothetical protein